LKSSKALAESLSCNMLLLSLSPQIAVTFSTPTSHYTNALFGPLQPGLFLLGFTCPRRTSPTKRRRKYPASQQNLSPLRLSPPEPVRANPAVFQNAGVGLRSNRSLEPSQRAVPGNSCMDPSLFLGLVVPRSFYLLPSDFGGPSRQNPLEANVSGVRAIGVVPKKQILSSPIQ
jgi:hypothetical protein